MAYHLDVDIESAALLTFACLKSRDGECSDILDQIAVTWEEMKRPEIHASAADRKLIAILAEEPPPKGLSDVGRFVWTVVGNGQRAEISSECFAQPRRWASFFS